MVRGLNPESGTKFIRVPKHAEQLWGLPSFLFNGYWRSFSGVKQPERDTNHSLPSSAEVKNEWCRTSTAPTHLHGVGLGKFYLYVCTNFPYPIKQVHLRALC
jgi:hypothetical protein